MIRRHGRQIAALVLLGFLMTACAAGAASPPAAPNATTGPAAATGIVVTARAGPVCPVERVPPDPACAPRPVVGATIRVADATGHFAGAIVTDAAGTGSLALAPGDYVVTSDPAGGLMRGPAPINVTVHDGEKAIGRARVRHGDPLTAG